MHDINEARIRKRESERERERKIKKVAPNNISASSPKNVTSFSFLIYFLNNFPNFGEKCSCNVFL